jgi:outer membrane PBP1 activator LpoA protein
MNVRTSRRMVAAVIAAVMLGLLGAGCATTTPDKGPALYQRIESAKTRADHEGLAQYYEQQARAAKDQAQQHRRMQELYRTFSATRPSGAGMAQHCANLVTEYEKAAVEYSGLATLHRQLAAAAKE